MSETSATPPPLSDFPDSCKPGLAVGVRRRIDPITGQLLLVFPEAVVELKGPGPAIISLCDGRRTFGQIVAALAEKYNAPLAILREDVARYLHRLRDRILIEVDAARINPAASEFNIPSPAPHPSASSSSSLARPLGLVAELTYRCPLHCPYCSNPTQYPTGRGELTTDAWRRVLHEAAGLGVLHALFSGGEPLARKDLEAIVSAARDAGLYTNLITSAIGLTPARANALRAAGLDSVQISFQSDEADLADSIAGTTAHARKLDAAQLVRDVGFPLTVNVVLHRQNIDRTAQIIALAERLGARRLELANTQFYGWAMKNRSALLPTPDRVDAAAQIAAAAQQRLRGAMDILFVAPDYFSDRPKPCMNGWGRRYIAVNPVGDVLPCPTAGEIRSLKFDNVADRDLAWIWQNSAAFNVFRGTAWMPEPCRSCDRREIDFGGCRCQAAIVTGDAANTDPVCGLSPNHRMISEVLLESARETKPLVFRVGPSGSLSPVLRGEG
jgi:pyrroloquinoline quinone biosynthesis protein E